MYQRLQRSLKPFHSRWALNCKRAPRVPTGYLFMPYFGHKTHKLFCLHSSRTHPSQNKKRWIPYTKDQRAMGYAPLQTSLTCCLFSSPPGWQGRSAYPNPSLFTQIPGEQLRIFVPFFHAASFLLHFPSGSLCGSPVPLPPAPIYNNRGSQKGSSCFYSVWASRPFTSSLQRFAALWHTCLISHLQTTCVRHGQWLPSESPVVFNVLRLSEAAKFSKSI